MQTDKQLRDRYRILILKAERAAKAQDKLIKAVNDAKKDPEEWRRMCDLTSTSYEAEWNDFLC